MKSNLSFARRVKSSQGSRRGTCGWITSFIFLQDSRKNKAGQEISSEISDASFSFSILEKNSVVGKLWNDMPEAVYLSNHRKRTVPHPLIFIEKSPDFSISKTEVSSDFAIPGP